MSDLEPRDLRIDTFSNNVSATVRVTHLPTGLVASAEGPSRYAARQEAMAALAEKVAWRGVYPGMCIDPETCRGYSHCPRDYSCCE